MKKGTKVFMAAALAVTLALAFCLTADAAVGKKLVSVQEVYVDDVGVVMIKVLKPNDTVITFSAPAEEKNQIMAVALTALSLNKMVRIEADWAVPKSEIISISLVNE